MEECGHMIIAKCHEEKPKCTFKCYDRLDCGHACERNCHKNDDPDHEQVILNSKMHLQNVNFFYVYSTSVKNHVKI